MKRFFILIVLATPFFTVACANSLEQIVDEHHMARIDASNANKPLNRGAADGLGNYYAQTRAEEGSDMVVKTNP